MYDSVIDEAIQIAVKWKINPTLTEEKNILMNYRMITDLIVRVTFASMHFLKF